MLLIHLVIIFFLITLCILSDDLQVVLPLPISCHNFSLKLMLKLHIFMNFFNPHIERVWASGERLSINVWVTEQHSLLRCCTVTWGVPLQREAIEGWQPMASAVQKLLTLSNQMAHNGLTAIFFSTQEEQECQRWSTRSQEYISFVCVTYWNW